MSDTLLSQTLPTIVGMGVVAHVTDRVLPRGRRGTATRSRPKSHTKGPVIHRGPRGGRYVIRRGRRVYL